MSKCEFDVASEDVYEYIANLIPKNAIDIDVFEGACVVPVTNESDIVYSNVFLEQPFAVGTLGYFTIPKIYGLMDTSSLDVSGITTTLNQPFLNIKGQGVIVGIVDTGIDYISNSFRDSAGFTRIDTIWDQTLAGVSNNNDILYGRTFQKDDINRAIEAYGRGEDPYEYVPSRDEIGHGTFLAGVAAASKTQQYTGAAPESEIAVVKLKEAKEYLRDFFFVKKDVVAFAETDIMMGVKYLNDYAQAKSKPLVILLGVGSASGARLGVSPLSSQLNEVSGVKNTVVVVPVGNEANKRGHYEGRAISDKQADTVEINVSTEGDGFVMEIWANSLDILSVSIVSPSGEEIPRIPARMGENEEFAFLLERSRVTVDYQISGLVSGYEVIFLRFTTPAVGIWKVNVYTLTNIEGKYNAWLSLQELTSSEVFFVKSTPDVTLTDPASTAKVITVGAYDHITGSDASFSSRGYTADARVKPDLIAPGVNVYGPAPDNRFTNKTGTSISAAHVAGSAALLLCWGVFYGNQENIGSNEVKLILLRGATRDNNTMYPNPVSGYGRLNLIQSFYQMRIK